MTTWLYPALFVVAVIGAGVGVQNYYAAHPQYRIYHMRYGTAYCGEATRHNCGYTLSRCTDDRVYVCLQDLMWDTAVQE